MSLDLANVTAQDDDAPIKRNAHSKILDTPFPGWLKETHNTGRTKVVGPFAADDVPEVVAAIRAAGRVTGLGVRIQKLADGRIRFAGKTKTERAPLTDEQKAARRAARAAKKAANGLSANHPSVRAKRK